MTRETNQQVEVVMMVKSVNQNLLNEFLLEKTIFALAIENMMIEMMTKYHHPTNYKNKKKNVLSMEKEAERVLLQCSNSSAKYQSA
mgnify:CR=1 FL=1